MAPFCVKQNHLAVTCKISMCNMCKKRDILCARFLHIKVLARSREEHKHASFLQEKDICMYIHNGYNS